MTVIINAREKVVDKDKYSFQEIVELALGKFDSNPNIVYTLTYTKGKKQPSKSLVFGEEVNVKDGMIINVSRTDKS
ncbi:multiubiquitin domain-containing protein [Bacillaceae bacterium S4-13-58]